MDYYSKHPIYYHKYIKYKTKYLNLISQKNIQSGSGNSQKQDILVDKINNNFQKLLRGFKNPKYHLFFESHEWFVSYMKPFENEIKDKYKDYKYNNSGLDIESIDKCKYIPKKVADEKLLKNIYSIMTDPNTDDFNIIRKNLNKLYDYMLPSNIPKNFFNDVKNSDKETINVIIAGSGPIGLFTALYLSELYHNKSALNIKMNILLIDNRIQKEGIRLPYTRMTQFGFDISHIQPFINQIFCWENKIMTYGTRQFDFINILENILYIAAYNHKIPMYFTKKYETFDKLKDFATKNNFHYILDCTGGRLQTNFKNGLEWDKYLFKKGKYEVKLGNDNYYRFYVNDKLYSHISIVLHLYDRNMKEIHVGNLFGTIDVPDDDDIELLKKYNNECFTLNNYKIISRNFNNKNARCLLPYILEITKINESKIKYVKITYFNTNSHHANLCAKKITNNLTYIGLGNTLGTSEYGIYFGMDTGILFSKQICHLIGAIHEN